MNELFEAAAHPWELLISVLVVFGLAPGLVLRLLVLCYPKNHPRRAELVAELHVVKRVLRPLWVAEQVSVCLFEGLGERRSIRERTRRARSFLWALVRGVFSLVGLAGALAGVFLTWQFFAGRADLSEPVVAFMLSLYAFKFLLVTAEAERLRQAELVAERLHAIAQRLTEFRDRVLQAGDLSEGDPPGGG